LRNPNIEATVEESAVTKTSARVEFLRVQLLAPSEMSP
jgi:hypothetical protein